MNIDYTGYNALVIDDEPPFRKFFKTLLEKAMNFRVFEACNPIEGFEILNKEKVNLIILDMEMPVMDGFTALKHIREVEENKHTPVIICTALRSRELFAGLAKLSISDYIIKPSNSQIIIGKVKLTMDKCYDLNPEDHIHIESNNDFEEADEEPLNDDI